MTRYKFRILFAALLVIAITVVLTSIAREPTKRAFINGSILTMDASNSVHQALLIDNGKVVQTGSNEEINALIDRKTVVTDLNGKTLMPGIIDAHGHFPGSGLNVLAVDLNSPPIGKVTTIEELISALQEKSSQLSDDEWVVGYGYDDSVLTDNRHPTRADLDKVSKTQPVYIMHISGHMGVANSKALALANIDAKSKNPEGGVIVKEAVTGIPTGLLEENATAVVQKLASDFSALDFLKMIRYASDEYLALGVTTAQSGGVDKRLYSGLRWASKAGIVPSRLVVFPLFDELGAYWLNGEVDLAANNTEHFYTGPVKIIADGSIQGFTGYLNTPYHEPYKGDSEYRGYPRIDQQRLDAEISRYHKAGMQLAVHGNGDAAIDAIISAFDKAQQQNPVADPRLILIHAQMARDDQLDDFRRLGITPSFFSAHTYYWGDRHTERFMGPKRAARMSPARSAIDRKLRFSIHLDTPVVPMDPFFLFFSAVNRISSTGRIIGKEQRIDTINALRAVTIDAAWQVHQEDNRGSLEPGKWADLIVLSTAPLLNPAAIRDIEVEETLIAGKSVFRR